MLQKHCGRMIAEVRKRFKPSLFQHVGTQSSLKGKTQKLKVHTNVCPIANKFDAQVPLFVFEEKRFFVYLASVSKYC